MRSTETVGPDLRTTRRWTLRSLATAGGLVASPGIATPGVAQSDGGDVDDVELYGGSDSASPDELVWAIGESRVYDGSADGGDLVATVEGTRVVVAESGVEFEITVARNPRLVNADGETEVFVVGNVAKVGGEPGLTYFFVGELVYEGAPDSGEELLRANGKSVDLTSETKLVVAALLEGLFGNATPP